MNIYDIIIIGGGISGLNCSLRLLKENYNILLLDERNYIGGRILTYYEKNYKYELGAGRFNNNHKNLLELIKDFNLTKIKINDKCDYIDKYKKIDYKIINLLMKKIIKKIKKIKNFIIISKQYTFKEMCLKYFSKNYVN